MRTGAFISDLTMSLDRIVDWFIPATLASDKDARKQARLFLISHLLGPFIGNVVPIALYCFDPTPSWDVAVLAASISGFWVFPFILRAIGHYDTLALVSIQNLMFCILWSCFFYGGVLSPTLPWVLTIPMLAFFYIGGSKRARYIAFWMFAVNLAAFVAATLLLTPPSHEIPNEALQGLGIVSTIAAAAYVSMMAVYYARAIASQNELEAVRKQQITTADHLRKAVIEVERAGKAKSEFLAKMSHELRTPLNAVIGYSQMLLEEAADTGDDESVPDIERIHAAGAHLLRLVNNVLDLSKIEAGHMELFLEDYSIETLIRGVVESLRPEIEANRNTVSIEVDPGMPVVHGDQMKTQAALANLVLNAAKFTADGHITVACRQVEDAHGPAIRLEVRDTGIGIDAESLPRIFERFVVVNDETSTKYGGTGIGLALTRELTYLLGGSIEAQSKPGCGSTFQMVLPLRATEGARQPRRHTSRSGGIGGGPPANLQAAA